MFILQKSQYRICISLTLSQKRAITQLKIVELPQNLNLAYILCFISLKFECQFCIPPKVIDRKPQFGQNLSQKRAITLNKFVDNRYFRT